MDQRKILLIIFDGLGDRPVTELGHKTPLEAAPKPNLDWFAANGASAAHLAGLKPWDRVALRES